MATDCTLTPPTTASQSPPAPRKQRRKYTNDGPGSPFTCPNCGATHIRTHRGQKFCSPECYRTHWKANVQGKATAAGAQAISEASERGTLARRIDGTIAPRRRAEDAADTGDEQAGVQSFPQSVHNASAPTGSDARARLARWREEDGTSGAQYAARGNYWAGRLAPSRILTITGYGVSLRVERGQLVIRQGGTHSVERGAQPETIRLSRGLHDVQVIVMLGRHGGLSLDALQWCADQSIAVLVLNRDGELVSAIAPPAAGKITLRRAQYAADQLTVARAILLRKIAAQERARPELAVYGTDVRREVEQAPDVKALQGIEGRLSRAYWMYWEDTQLAWKGPGVPDGWRRFGGRTSVNGSPRKARHPANAMLNLAYHVLAGRITRALTSRGLDPDVGSLHMESEKRCDRHHLAYDIIEALRPRVDVKLFAWIEAQVWRRADFAVDHEAVVRVHPALTRVVVQESQLPEALIEAEIDAYVRLIRAPATAPTADPQQIAS